MPVVYPGMIKGLYMMGNSDKMHQEEGGDVAVWGKPAEMRNELRKWVEVDRAMEEPRVDKMDVSE